MADKRLTMRCLVGDCARPASLLTGVCALHESAEAMLQFIQFLVRRKKLTSSAKALGLELINKAGGF